MPRRLSDPSPNAEQQAEMNTVERLLGWMAATSWSVGLRESLYVWPFAESIHVLVITLFVGTTLMLDLRLLSIAFRRTPASEFTTRLLPWTRVGFVVMVATGLLLFYANPVKYYHNLFFRIKVVLLIGAGLNVWLFHGRTHRQVGAWDLDHPAPRAARAAAVVSLVAWAAVVVVGRLIAYNWFDCDLQPQTSFVNWASACAPVALAR